jgi:hypothetical protein
MQAHRARYQRKNGAKIAAIEVVKVINTCVINTRSLL